MYGDLEMNDMVNDKKNLIMDFNFRAPMNFRAPNMQIHVSNNRPSK